MNFFTEYMRTDNIRQFQSSTIVRSKFHARLDLESIDVPFRIQPAQ
jgi:hypothetical protein